MRTGQPGHKDRTARTGQLEQNRLRQDSQGRTARTGRMEETAGQDSRNSSVRTEQSGQESKDRISGTTGKRAAGTG
jgi:hypothetical protein